MAFGVLFQSLGYHWLFAPLAGIVIYAGSAQFMAVGLLAAGVSYTEALIATFLLNSRHMFYGLSVLNRYSKRGVFRWYLIFGLTDETYSLVTAKIHQRQDSNSYYLYITAFNQCYWVVGCALGSSLQTMVTFDSRGFEFALVALFLVLLIEQIKAMNERWLLMIALMSSVVAYGLIPNHFLLMAIGMCLLVLLWRWNRVRSHG